MIRQDEKWKAFVVKNQAHYNKTNESKFNLIALTPEERGWTELFQIYPPKTRTGGSGTSPVNGRSYSWTYGFLPVGYFGVKNQSRVFTSSGTWTCPDGVNEIYVRCIAPGGTGNNGKIEGYSGGKGGGGGGFIMAKISTTPGNNYAVSISSGLTSFGGVMTATAGNSGANGGTGGNFTHTETPTVLFTGAGGDGNSGNNDSGGGGGGGGSELGKGGNGGTYGGGGGLHSSSVSSGDNSGGGGMLGASSSAGAGFKSPSSSNSGGGMFSSTGIKKTSSPYYDKLSAEITENLGAWGSPGNYGGGGAKVMFSGAHAGTNGRNATASSNAVAGGNGGFGGFGGGGGKGGRGGDSYHGSSGGNNDKSKPGANGGVGGAGGYGGGGGAGGYGGNGAYRTFPAGVGGAGSPGGAGGGGGGGGKVGSGGAVAKTGGNGAAGGYGGGGGGGGDISNTTASGRPGSGGAGGAGLVIIEW